MQNVKIPKLLTTPSWREDVPSRRMILLINKGLLFINIYRPLNSGSRIHRLSLSWTRHLPEVGTVRRKESRELTAVETVLLY